MLNQACGMFFTQFGKPQHKPVSFVPFFLPIHTLASLTVHACYQYWEPQLVLMPGEKLPAKRHVECFLLSIGKPQHKPVSFVPFFLPIHTLASLTVDACY